MEDETRQVLKLTVVIMQKYVLNVAICEVRHADTLARKIRREKYRSKAEVLGASKLFTGRRVYSARDLILLANSFFRTVRRAADDDDIETGNVSMGLKCPVSVVAALLRFRNDTKTGSPLVAELHEIKHADSIWSLLSYPML